MLTVVGGCQVRGEESHRREVQGTLGEHIKDDGEPPRRPRRLDAVVGLGFGQPQNLHAVRKQRREPGTQVEPSSVELREVGDELGGGTTLAAGEGC